MKMSEGIQDAGAVPAASTINTGEIMQSWHMFAGIFFFLVACFFYEYGKGQHRIGNETFLTPVFMMGAK